MKIRKALRRWLGSAQFLKNESELRKIVSLICTVKHGAKCLKKEIRTGDQHVWLISPPLRRKNSSECIRKMHSTRRKICLNWTTMRSILQHAWGLSFRIAEMGRAQKTATKDAMDALIRQTPQGQGINVRHLQAILAADSKSTGVQWFLKDKLSALVQNAYSPSDVPWNFNTESRVEYLVNELRQYYDFLSPAERGVKQAMTALTSRKEAPDPMKTRAAVNLLAAVKKRNLAQHVSDNAATPGMDKLSKDAAKQIQTTNRLFLRL